MANLLGSCCLQASFHGALPLQNQPHMKKPGHLFLQVAEMWTSWVILYSLLAATSFLGTALSSGFYQRYVHMSITLKSLLQQQFHQRLCKWSSRYLKSFFIVSNEGFISGMKWLVLPLCAGRGWQLHSPLHSVARKETSSILKCGKTLWSWKSCTHPKNIKSMAEIIFILEHWDDGFFPYIC